MKKKALLYLLTYVFLHTPFAQTYPVLLPAPKTVQWQTGALSLRSISLPARPSADKDIQFAFDELSRLIKEKTGIITGKNKPTPAIAIRYSITEKGFQLPDATELKRKSNRENYSLTINASGIQIKAQTSTGLYYAIQTIVQLIMLKGNDFVLPFTTIEDSPVISYRGVMMDFAHGGLPTVKEIKRQIDFLATFKNNQYYFYNEVSIELEGFPAIGYKSGYRKSEVADIIAYAKERHVDVIPFLNLYGHLHELVRQEKYASLAIGNYGHELNPDNPEVNKLLSNWIEQYTALFPSEFIHVGFDETWETKRLADERGQQINAEQLWLKQLAFVSGLLQKKGKTVMAWTDMNNYYPDVIKKLPPGVVPVVWEYKPDTAAINKFVLPVAKENKTFLIQPAVSGWGHIYPDVQYTYDNIALCLQAALKYGSPGFINSVWTDPVEPYLRPSWLFMAYGSVAAWQGEAVAGKDFSHLYSAVLYPAQQPLLQQIFDKLEETNIYLNKCLGKNTNSMPRGTITESWSNPFLPYYLKNTAAHIDDFRKARKSGEEAQELLIEALQKLPARDSGMLSSLLVSARLMTYSATRFIWAQTICDRWNKAMLEQKKNDFVYYDLTYLCHSYLTDMAEEITELKQEYQQAWLDEYMPYRLQSIAARFDIEYGLWRKLFLKVIDYRIEQDPAHVATGRFEEIFKPDF